MLNPAKREMKDIIHDEKIHVVKKAEEYEFENIILTTVDKLLSWSRYSSMWPLTFSTACCAIEMMATAGSHNDLARFGMEVFRATPRQADLMIVAGTITYKMAPRVKRLYDQMPEPKYVIAMGACATSGGPFHMSYGVVNGVDKIIPVDVYIPGCPPKPEALIDGILKLRERIKEDKHLTRKVNEVITSIKKMRSK